MQAPKTLQSKLIQLEQSLFDAEVRASRDALNRLIADDFVEIAARGIYFGKQQALQRVPDETVPVIRASNFSVSLLSEDLAQVLYRATMKKPFDTVCQYSLRSSLWKWRGGQWQIVFHQGTPTAAFQHR